MTALISNHYTQYGVRKFLVYLGFLMTVFFGIIFVVVFLKMAFTQDQFVSSWRWVHDTILIPIFWYLVPLLLAIFLVDTIKPDHPLSRALTKAPKFVHAVIVTLFTLATALAFSQLAGGCIWFLPTEGWWDRFVPDFVSEPFMIVFYATFSVIGTVITYAYYHKYVLTVHQK